MKSYISVLVLFLFAACGRPTSHNASESGKLPSSSAHGNLEITSVCYDLSLDGSNWNESRDLMCVTGDRMSVGSKIQFVFKTSDAGFETVHSQWELTLLSHGSTAYFNVDRFGVASEGRGNYSTALKDLSIEFNGKFLQLPVYSEESGTLKIGKSEDHYRTHH